MVKSTPICLVTGFSGSGKTTIVEKLVKELTGKGLKVATAKHHGHALEVDSEGKDSWRHKRAGAVATFLVAKGEIVSFTPTPPEEQVTPAELLPLLPAGTDLLLVEGFKGLGGYPRIEVVDKKPVVGDPAELVCVAATDPASVDAKGAQILHRDEVGAILTLLIEKVVGGS